MRMEILTNRERINNDMMLGINWAHGCAGAEGARPSAISALRSPEAATTMNAAASSSALSSPSVTPDGAEHAAPRKNGAGGTPPKMSPARREHLWRRMRKLWRTTPASLNLNIVFPLPPRSKAPMSLDSTDGVHPNFRRLPPAASSLEELRHQRWMKRPGDASPSAYSGPRESPSSFYYSFPAVSAGDSGGSLQDRRAMYAPYYRPEEKVIHESTCLADDHRKRCNPFCCTQEELRNPKDEPQCRCKLPFPIFWPAECATIILSLRLLLRSMSEEQALAENANQQQYIRGKENGVKDEVNKIHFFNQSFVCLWAVFWQWLGFLVALSSDRLDLVVAAGSGEHNAEVCSSSSSSSCGGGVKLALTVLSSMPPRTMRFIFAALMAAQRGCAWTAVRDAVLAGGDADSKRNHNLATDEFMRLTRILGAAREKDLALLLRVVRTAGKTPALRRIEASHSSSPCSSFSPSFVPPMAADWFDNVRIPCDLETTKRAGFASNLNWRFPSRFCVVCGHSVGISTIRRALIRMWRKLAAFNQRRRTATGKYDASRSDAPHPFCRLPLKSTEIKREVSPLAPHELGGYSIPDDSWRYTPEKSNLPRFHSEEDIAACSALGVSPYAVGGVMSMSSDSFNSDAAAVATAVSSSDAARNEKGSDAYFSGNEEQQYDRGRCNDSALGKNVNEDCSVIPPYSSATDTCEMWQDKLDLYEWEQREREEHQRKWEELERRRYSEALELMRQEAKRPKIRAKCSPRRYGDSWYGFERPAAPYFYSMGDDFAQLYPYGDECCVRAAAAAAASQGNAKRKDGGGDDDDDDDGTGRPDGEFSADRLSRNWSPIQFLVTSAASRVLSMLRNGERRWRQHCAEYFADDDDDDDDSGESGDEVRNERKSDYIMSNREKGEFNGNNRAAHGSIDHTDGSSSGGNTGNFGGNDGGRYSSEEQGVRKTASSSLAEHATDAWIKGRPGLSPTRVKKLRVPPRSHSFDVDKLKKSATGKRQTTMPPAYGRRKGLGTSSSSSSMRVTFAPATFNKVRLFDVEDPPAALSMPTPTSTNSSMSSPVRSSSLPAQGSGNMGNDEEEEEECNGRLLQKLSSFRAWLTHLAHELSDQITPLNNLVVETPFAKRPEEERKAYLLKLQELRDQEYQNQLFAQAY